MTAGTIYICPMSKPIRTAAMAGVYLTLASCSSGTGASRVYVTPESGERRHLAKIRQLTFSGNNAESYFSSDGKKLIFQRQEQVDQGCDQEYIMNIDGSGMRRISNGWGRTTCGFF